VSNSETGREGGTGRRIPPYHQPTMGVLTAFLPVVNLLLLDTPSMAGSVNSMPAVQRVCTVHGPVALFGRNPWVGGIAAPQELKGVTVGRKVCAELLLSSR